MTTSIKNISKIKNMPIPIFLHIKQNIIMNTFTNFLLSLPPACCHLSVVGGLRTSVTRIDILAGVFILLLVPPKPYRLMG